MGAAPAVARLSSAPDTCASDYAQVLLADLGRFLGPLHQAPLRVPVEHPAVSWAQSGLMSLTGFADGDPLMCPVPIASCADGALAALESLAGTDLRRRGSQLLGVRAAIAGYSRQGDRSPGGSCRLLPVADGLLAVNLARDSDWELLPAWLEDSVAREWDAVAAALRRQSAAPLIERARLLGLAVAQSEPPVEPAGWFEVAARGPAAPARTHRRPRVIDLSALWAGPLCGQLLQQCGADVIKVESSQRPDGARNGPRAFFDLLNAGKQSVALDLSTGQGREELKDLIAGADIVIESSRPRALRQLGIHAEECVGKQPGLTWVSLTAYGRGNPQEHWIAYGDDAAVAAGLSELMRQATGVPCMVADAVADPLTGLHAALAAWAGWQAGAGQLLSLSLTQVVGRCMATDAVHGDRLRQRQQEWTRLAGTPQRPIAPAVHAMARPLGADNPMR